MILAVAYAGRSAIMQSQTGVTVSMAPNLRRDRVSFNGGLKSPIRFREAISALHDVVISDLRFHKKDRSAYRAYLAEKERQEQQLRRAAAQAGTREFLAQWTDERRRGLEKKYQHMQKTYWDARQKYNDYLQQHDPELWRMLVPMDPVITVAPDVLFFECFSADESSYGCLTVDRNSFNTEREVSLGTTNVDYSWALYEHFQELRSYRQTRFTIDPAGFEVKVHQGPGYREEKIDLPSSWLRGYLLLQSAMALPMRRVPISREGLYNVLTWLKRHKARKSPRAIRFELEPGKPVRLVLEPWDQRFVLHSTPYPGQHAETIRTWGRDRLRVLARLLPLMDDGEAYLLGTGLPSYWSIRMGEMRLLLGLSGWTVNDWTGASAIDQILPPVEVRPAVLDQIKAAFQAKVSLTFREVCEKAQASGPVALAGLNRLASLGQLIHDMPAGVYRWRQIMPQTVSESALGPENPEVVESRKLTVNRQVSIARDEVSSTGRRMLAGQVQNRPVELQMDSDGRILRGKCTCSFHYQGGLRRGPCRHLQAMRTVALSGEVKPQTLESWFRGLGG